MRKIMAMVKADKSGISSDNIKHTKKLGKLKVQKLSKYQKLSKSKKKQNNIQNLPKFGTKKARPNFLTFEAKEIFNCL